MFRFLQAAKRAIFADHFESEKKASLPDHSLFQTKNINRIVSSFLDINDHDAFS